MNENHFFRSIYLYTGLILIVTAVRDVCVWKIFYWKMFFHATTSVYPRLFNFFITVQKLHFYKLPSLLMWLSYPS